MKQPKETFLANDDSVPADFTVEVAYAPSKLELAVDVGSGTGQLVEKLARNAQLAVGVELSLDCALKSHRRATQRGVRNALFVVADARLLPFRDESCDYVTSRYALHHTELDASLTEIARVIKPGGRACLRDNIAPLPRLEGSRLWHTTLAVLQSAITGAVHGVGAGIRALERRLHPDAMDHALHANRRVPLRTYRAAHEKALPGCRFVRSRHPLVFWEAPVVKWEAPERSR